MSDDLIAQRKWTSRLNVLPYRLVVRMAMNKTAKRRRNHVGLFRAPDAIREQPRALWL